LGLIGNVSPRGHIAHLNASCDIKRFGVENLMTYLLRDVDDAMWRQFKSAAALQGKSVRELLIAFIQSVVKGEQQS